jgi:hypothetical protein
MHPMDTVSRVRFLNWLSKNYPNERQIAFSIWHEDKRRADTPYQAAVKLFPHRLVQWRLSDNDSK